MKLEKIEIVIKQKLPESLKKVGKEKYTNEIRLHPLLKWFWAAVAPAREEYKPYIVPENIMQDLLTPRVHYFVDPEKNTPIDPLYGRINRNEAYIIPNLWSWAKIAVCRLTEKESMYLKDISVEQFYDGFLASEQFFKIHYEKRKNNNVYPTINMNFLRPSASSVLHPHFQLLITPIPVPILGMFLENLNIISNLYNSENDYFRLFGIIWSRPLKNLDVSDMGFAEIGFKMALTYRLPEKVAESLKKFWSK